MVPGLELLPVSLGEEPPDFFIANATPTAPPAAIARIQGSLLFFF
jgi:hypothetical protein